MKKKVFCLISAVCIFGVAVAEPIFLKTPAEAASSPHDNLRVGVPAFTDYVVDREYFAIGFSRAHRQPLWGQYRLLRQEVENSVTERSNRFHRDPTIPESPLPTDYARSGYDRGHMAPAGDMKWSELAMVESFLMTNMSPQHPRCNRLTWKYLEDQVREWAKEEQELCVVCGPVFTEKSTAIGNGTIRVPIAYFKIAYDVTPPAKMIAFLIPNRNCRGELRSFAVSVEVVETLTGFNFFNNLPEETQNKLEASVTIEVWNWTLQTKRPKSSKSPAK